MTIILSFIAFIALITFTALLSVTVSAPGKLVLFGEHAVVYGHPCVVTAVGQRLHLTGTKTDDGLFHLDAPEVNVTGYKKRLADLGTGDIPKGATFAEFAVREFLRSHPINGGIAITTRSEFSAAYGFGSSSTVAVCMLAALHELCGMGMDLRVIFNMGYRTVMEVQKTGSGVDIAAAVYGGTVLYEIGGKRIEPLSISSLPLVIGYTGVKTDTPTILLELAEKRKKDQKKFDHLYSAMGELSMHAKNALEEGDFPSAGKLMNDNQGLLKELGVSSPKLDAMILAACDAGAWGAKLSGAGRGDCMVALVPEEKRHDVFVALRGVGGEPLDVAGHASGVTVE
jgi:mevalonate kinase